MSDRNWPHSLVMPSIWMLIVGNPKRDVHSRGQMPLLLAMQLMSMYPTYLLATNLSLVFASVLSKTGLLFVQYMEVFPHQYGFPFLLTYITWFFTVAQ